MSKDDNKFSLQDLQYYFDTARAYQRELKVYSSLTLRKSKSDDSPSEETPIFSKTEILDHLLRERSIRRT